MGTRQTPFSSPGAHANIKLDELDARDTLKARIKAAMAGETLALPRYPAQAFVEGPKMHIREDAVIGPCEFLHLDLNFPWAVSRVCLAMKQTR